MKECYYAVQVDGGEWEFKKVTHGIRHVVCGLEEVVDKLDVINDPNYFTHLRVFVNKLGEENTASLVDEISELCSVNQLDIKFRPILSEKEAQSTFVPDRQLFSINEAIIDDYIESSDTQIDKADLLEGYRRLNED